MAPPHTATSTTSQTSGRSALQREPIILSRVPFKARLTPPHPPAFNCSDENMIKLYVQVQKEEAMKRLWLKEAKIREKFRLKEEDLLGRLQKETDECKTLDGVSESLAKMDIDRNTLKEEEEGRPHQGCPTMLPRKRNDKKAENITQDDEVEFQSDMPPYKNHSSKSNGVLKYGKETEEDSRPPRHRGYRKDAVITRSTFPPPPSTNPIKPNQSTKKAPLASDTRYSLFTLEQDLATSANINEFSFKQPPLLPLRPATENLPRLNPNISHFSSDFPSSRRSNTTTSHPLQTPPNKIIGRSHLPAQQSSFFILSDEPDDSEKENLDELVVLREQQQQWQQRQRLLFTPPATPITTTTATSKANPNPYISSSSAPCSPTGRKRVRDDSSDDLCVDIAITTPTPTSTTLSINTISSHECQRQSPDADMTMEFGPQVKRLRLFCPPPRLESSKPFLLLRDSKGLFGPQSLVLR